MSSFKLKLKRRVFLRLVNYNAAVTRYWAWTESQIPIPLKGVGHRYTAAYRKRWENLDNWYGSRYPTASCRGGNLARMEKLTKANERRIAFANGFFPTVVVSIEDLSKTYNELPVTVMFAERGPTTPGGPAEFRQAFPVGKEKGAVNLYEGDLSQGYKPLPDLKDDKSARAGLNAREKELLDPGVVRDANLGLVLPDSVLDEVLDHSLPESIGKSIPKGE